jgi:hypothetical protein
MNGVVWMALPIEEAGERGLAPLNIARVRDYWLGGVHNSQADRDFAAHATMCAPHIPFLVRAQRALLGRMVRHLLGQGVRQFLDLGSGIPTMGHVHEIAHEVDPVARVVYVDSDPGVADDARQLLAGNEYAIVLDVDIREPGTVLAAATALLDLTEPVALLVIATLQHIPDSDDPVGVIAAYLDALCSGSYLAIVHHGPDPQLQDGYRLFDQMQLGRRPEVSLRDQALSGMFFSGLELVEPGIVPLVLWRPDPDDELGRNPERLPIHAGLGRKP